MLAREEIERKVEELSPWGQNIHLTGDFFTPGPLDVEARWQWIKTFVPKTLKDMRVLDVGCNAGFFSIEMIKREADYVLGIDFQHHIEQARFVHKVKTMESRVKGVENIDFKVASIYTLPLAEKFDLTLCLGTLYHLKYPFLALKRISELTSGMIVLETEALTERRDADRVKFIENTYRNDGTNWWLFGEECLKGMLRSVGFKFVKVYAYPDFHPIFGSHYSQGLSEEGIEKGRRIVAIGIKRLCMEKFGMLLSEIPELETEIDLDNLGELADPGR